MKRRLGIILLLICVILVGCTQGGGTGNTENIENLDYEKIYQPIIDEIKEIILSKEDNEQILDDGIKEEHFGLVDLINTSVWNMNKGGLIGYSIKDYIGDDKPELVIGFIEAEEHDENKSTYTGKYVFQIYSIIDGKVELIVSSDYAGELNIMDDRTFIVATAFEEDQIITVNKLEGKNLVPVDIYKTQYDVEAEKMVYSKDKDGNLDTDDFVDMNISDEAFGELMMEYWYAALEVELTPIVKFDYLSELIDNPGGSYRADYYYFDVFEYEENGEYPDLKEKYIINDGQYSVKVIVDATRDMKDFEIVKLSTYESEAVGIDYNVDDTLYEVGELIFGEQIMIQLQIPEHFSDIGITFIDDSGERRYYIIYESGKDGSLGASEIYPSVG